MRKVITGELTLTVLKAISSARNGVTVPEVVNMVPGYLPASVRATVKNLREAGHVIRTPDYKTSPNQAGRMVQVIKAAPHAESLILRAAKRAEYKSVKTKASGAPPTAIQSDDSALVAAIKLIAKHGLRVTA